MGTTDRKDYEGCHRPKVGAPETDILEAIGKVRDVRAAINDYTYRPRHSAEFRDEGEQPACDCAMTEASQRSCPAHGEEAAA